MQWIVGLGNPGKAYEFTRHNVGWMVTDALAEIWAVEWHEQGKWQAVVGRSDKVGLIKPLTFMNKSGVAVRSVLQFYEKRALEGREYPWLVVVHDDLDMRLGTWKIEMGHGPKAHNGLLSLYEELGTDQFYHVRIGIDARETTSPRIPGKDYVLQPFPDDERKVIVEAISAIVKDLQTRIE